MKQEKQQEIALMRYGAIAPIIAGLDERYPSKTAFYTEISAKGLMGPDGKLHHYAPATIEKWYLDYQNHGFEGLVPKGRSDAGMSRKLDEELQERIRYFKTNYPRMSAYRYLQAAEIRWLCNKRTGIRIHRQPLCETASVGTAADTEQGYAPL